MRILLTGASGFLGRNLLMQVPRDWSVTAVYHRDDSFAGFEGVSRPNVKAERCNLSDAGEVESLVARCGREWDACVYLAAKVDIPWSVRYPLDDLEANTRPLLSVLEAIRCKKFLYFSSGAVYDGLAGEVNPGAACNPTLPYAISKLACEKYVEFFHFRRRTIERFLTVRFFGAFGPYEAARKIHSRLVRAFAFERAQSFTIYGDGRNLIDAMYVDDAVEAVRRMVCGDCWDMTVNLAGGRPVSIEMLVKETAQALGVPEPVIVKEGIANEHNDFWGGTADMERYWAFTPAVTAAEGVRRLRDFLVMEINRAVAAANAGAGR